MIGASFVRYDPYGQSDDSDAPVAYCGSSIRLVLPMITEELDTNTSSSSLAQG